ncbi:MAG: molybdopterin-dependent oxidoreductase, partial [Pseudonocardiaceae bacterium]
MTSSGLSSRVVAPATPSRLSVSAAALVGLLAVALGLGVGHLVGGLISPTASPFLAVGGTAIDLTPTWLKDFAVRTFGSYDKIVLLLGMAVVIGLFGAVAGVLSRRSRVPGLALIVVLGAVATVAVATRPGAGPLDLLAPLAALVAGSVTFVVLHGWGLPGGAADAAAVGASRRTLLAGSA